MATLDVTTHDFLGQSGAIAKPEAKSWVVGIHIP